MSFMPKLRIAQKLPLVVVGITDETFRKTDVNRDGRLSLQEFVNARYVDFLAADRNQDGSLSFEEVRLYSRC